MDFHTSRRVLKCRPFPLIMGVVNTTPDSFSDGGLYLATDSAVKHGLGLLEEGADILDIGGESTRPGAQPVSPQEELERVVPVVRGILREAPNAVISVDTTKSSVARAALEAGAEIVNDVSGGTFDPEMVKVVATSGCGVIIMHIRGTPATMQSNTTYDDLVGDVRLFLHSQAQAFVDAGVDPAKIAVDPGIGFGKSVEGNLALIRHTEVFRFRGGPVLIGPSRKSFIGAITGVADPAQRVYGTCGAVLASFRAGAGMVRVHDVQAAKEALAVYGAVFAPS